jgi:hypothetical protein
MNTKNNRFHRGCENVEGNLNYTKFNYFPPDQLAESACAKSAKQPPPGFSHGFPNGAFAALVENAATLL